MANDDVAGHEKGSQPTSEVSTQMLCKQGSTSHSNSHPRLSTLLPFLFQQSSFTVHSLISRLCLALSLANV